MASTQVNKINDSTFTDLFELLNLAKINGYKRIGDFVVENVPGTTTWKNVLTKDNAPLTVNKMVRDFYIRKGQAEETICKKAVQVLEKSDVQSFEKIQYSRLALEFKNGVYILNDTQAEGSVGRFVKRGTSQYETIRSTIYTSSRSHLNFDDGQYGHWSEIETPHLDRILDLQFSSEVKKWMYILLGRLLYPSGLLDKWQVAPSLYGVPASGKTTLLNMMCDIIGLTHSQKIDMNDNKDLMLEERDSARLLVLEQVTTLFPDACDQISEIISGRTIEGAKWSSPIIMSGNSELVFKDILNKLDRRILTFEFTNSPNCPASDVDLKEEYAKILRKINEAYLEAVEEYMNERCIWDKLPSGLTDFKKYRTVVAYPYIRSEEDEEVVCPDVRIIEPTSGCYKLSRV